MRIMASLPEQPEIISRQLEADDDNNNNNKDDKRDSGGLSVNTEKSHESRMTADPMKTLSLLEANGFFTVKKIGTGSYSKVKLAYSKNHKAMVAIKIVSKHHVPKEFLRKLLYNEIKVIKFLKHENIIKYYQSIESSYRLYIIMQYAENGSVLDLIHKNKRIGEAQACNIFRQVMSAIEYCHSQGVAHRDIKCENILLDKKNVVKLVDFGFAKCYRSVPKSKGEEKLEALLAQKSTQPVKPAKEDQRLSETYCGSFAYASPEILRGIPYDPFVSDIWAMGCVLYTMVFGRLPFDDRHLAKLLKQVQAPIVFSKRVNTSPEFKACCYKIFVPAKSRVTIEELKQDVWVTTKFMEYDPILINAVP